MTWRKGIVGAEAGKSKGTGASGRSARIRGRDYDGLVARIFFFAGTLSLLFAALAPAGAWYVDRKMSKDVILITPADPSVVVVNRAMYELDPSGSVPELYGKALSKPVRVVRPDPRDVVVPEEDKSLTLLNAGGDRHPLQVQTVWLAVKYGSPSAAFGGVVLLVLGAWWKRRRRAPAASPA
jgi:hypothetical protein